MGHGSSPKIIVNFAVENLERAVEFFDQLGFAFDSRFSDENGAGMVLSDETFVMLLRKDLFQNFAKKEIVDSTTHAETILSVAVESRERVDQLVQKALAAGGRPTNDPIDMGFMYGWGFQDPDGHLWEFFWMDPSGRREEVVREKEAATA